MNKIKDGRLWIMAIILVMLVNQLDWSYYGKQSINLLFITGALSYLGYRFVKWIQLNRKREE